MRGFIILCLSALAVAAPQGYNYPSQAPSNQYLAPAGGGAQQGYQQQQPQQPLISKRFFIHSAPEEDDVEFQQRDIVVGQPRKNFNVVFVKSPSGSSQKTKIRVIPAVNEEKTVVYVLSKKGGENEIITQVEEQAATTNKPEVFFIKYKTNEEAEHAQNTIQAEYDLLGGSSIVSNEGVGQVQSVIGSLDGQGGAGGGYAAAGSGPGASFGGAGSDFGGATGAGSSGHGGASAGQGSANTAYLPPVKKQ